MSISAVLANAQPFHVENCDVFAGCDLLPDRSIHAIVSSPPYLGLRDYGIPPRTWPDGLVCCYGLEPDVASYVRHTVLLFEEFRRVLRDDGVIWWNVGDSYATGAGKVGECPGGGKQGANWKGPMTATNRMIKDVGAGNKMLIPHRVAIALADAGWIIRQDNVWAKKSPMPESISGWRWGRCRVKVNGHQRDVGYSVGSTAERPQSDSRHEGPYQHAKWSPCPGCRKCEPNDGYVLRRGSWRTTTAHEYIFQIVKSGEYFCDGDAASEQTAQPERIGKLEKTFSTSDPLSSLRMDVGRVVMRTESRNPRSVWHLSSESYKGAHFATFPSELVRRCLVASCSPGGCCPKCGSQYAPRVSKERIATRPALNPKVWRADEYDEISQRGELSPNRDPQRHIAVSRVEGYYPSCTCSAGPAVPPIVLEPFCGSGTTLQVARHHGHRALGFEVNPAYIELAKERIVKVPRCAKVPTKSGKKRPKMPQQQTFLET